MSSTITSHSLLFSEDAILRSAARMDNELKYLSALALIKSLAHFFYCLLINIQTILWSWASCRPSFYKSLL